MAKKLLMALFVAGASLSFGLPVAASAADDPGIHEIYQAAESGHLDQAQKMIAQVLKNHPNSAKAHYVAAELDAKAGNLASAREELQTAERIDPSHSFAQPQALNALTAALSTGQHVAPNDANSGVAPAKAAHFPWGMVLAIGAIFAVIWMIMRRRSSSGGYPSNGSGGPGGMGGGYSNYPPVPPTGGAGSGLLGGLASGLAVGAGVAVGERVVDRLLGGDSESGHRERYSDRDDNRPDPNADMGGNDFGVNDSSSWDSNDSGGGDSGGGGGDWD